MITSLPACPTSHPGTPSEIRISNGTYGGKPFKRHYCAVCKSLAAKHRHSDRREASLKGYLVPLAKQPYGVFPRMTGPPPERLLAISPELQT